MDLNQLESFFGWMIIINAGIMVFTTLMFWLCKGLVFKLHGRLFEISKENLSILIYAYLGTYKIAIIVFNIVPYLALNFMA